MIRSHCGKGKERIIQGIQRGQTWESNEQGKVRLTTTGKMWIGGLNKADWERETVQDVQKSESLHLSIDLR